MGHISGLSSKMSAGKINPGKYQMTNTRWEERESRSGTAQIYFCQTLVDTSGAGHELALFAMSTTAYGSSERNVHINKKGQLVTVDDETEANFNRNIGAGKYIDSLNYRGFSPKKLDNIATEPEGLDGQWVVIDTPPSGKVDEKTGTPWTDIIVVELLDSPKGGGGKSGTAATAKKVAAKPVVEEEEEEESSDESDDDDAEEIDADEEEIAAAVEFTQSALSDPDTFIKNFDADKHDGGIHIQDLNTSVWKHSKAKGAAKGKLASLVGNPAFHTANADGYTFDEEDGVVRAEKKAAKKKVK